MSTIDEKQAQKIIDRYVAGESSYDLADEYDLWQTSICNLIRGKTWKRCVRPDNIQEIVKSRDKRKGKICKNLVPLTALQEDLIVGSLLGDGWMTSVAKSNRTNSRFLKKQSCGRKDYLDWHEKIMGPYGSGVRPIWSDDRPVMTPEGPLRRERVKSRLVAHEFYTYRHPNLTKFRQEWYDSQGVKHVPDNLELNPFRISVWFFDDGSNCVRNRTAVLCTQSFPVEEVEFLSQKLKDFDLRPSVVMSVSRASGRKMPILKFTKNSYDNLVFLVKPHMLWDCMSHKVKWRPAKKQWQYSGKFTENQAREAIRKRKYVSARDIAKEYGVHVNTIYDLVSGRSWSHLNN